MMAKSDSQPTKAAVSAKKRKIVVRRGPIDPKAAVGAKKRKIVVPPGKVDPKGYNEVVARARLVDLRLVSCRSEVTADALEGDRSGWSLKAGDDLVDWRFEEDKGRLWARICFKAECIDGRTRPITVEGHYLVVYGVDGEIDTVSANHFVARVARFACYPYFRTLFASLLGQANIVLPPLPVLKEAPRAIPQVKAKGASGSKPVAKAAAKPSSPAIRPRGKT